MAKATDIARICQVLSAEARVRIVQLLRGSALCVGALAERLGVTQGAVSQHLRILRDAGLVIPEKRGCYVHYRLDPKALARWRQALGRLLTAAEEKPCRRTRRKEKRHVR